MVIELRDVGMYLLFTSLVFVMLASCKPFMGNDPRQYQGHGIIAVLRLLPNSLARRHGDR